MLMELAEFSPSALSALHHQTPASPAPDRHRNPVDGNSFDIAAQCTEQFFLQGLILPRG